MAVGTLIHQAEIEINAVAANHGHSSNINKLKRDGRILLLCCTIRNAKKKGENPSFLRLRNCGNIIRPHGRSAKKREAAVVT